MDTITPPRNNFEIIETPETFRFIIPAQKSVFVMCFLAVWLCMWTLGEGAGLKDILYGTTKGESAGFTLSWLIGWTFFGIMALWHLLWMAGGTDIVIIDRKASVFTLMWQIFGATVRTRRFETGSIRHLKVPVQSGTRRNLNAVIFDYGAKTYRFGYGLNESEASDIVAELRRRSPLLETTKH